MNLVEQAEANGMGKEKEKGRKLKKMKTFLNELGNFIEQEREKRKRKEGAEDREIKDKENWKQGEKSKRKIKKNYGTSIRKSEQLES